MFLLMWSRGEKNWSDVGYYASVLKIADQHALHKFTALYSPVWWVCKSVLYVHKLRTSHNHVTSKPVSWRNTTLFLQRDTTLFLQVNAVCCWSFPSPLGPLLVNSLPDNTGAVGFANECLQNSTPERKNISRIFAPWKFVADVEATIDFMRFKKKS